MIVEARVAHPQEMSIIWLPFDRVFRQRVLPIFKSEGILKNVDQYLFARMVSINDGQGETEGRNNN